MSDAVIGFLGVIVGAGVAGAVAPLGEQFTTKREREARQAVREQERKDVHDAFQREAIIALHNAVNRLFELKLEMYSPFMVEGDQQPPPPWGFAPSPSMSETYSQMLTARAKVFDDELRRLVGEFDERTSAAGSATSKEDVNAAMSAGVFLLEEIEERVNSLLKKLY